MMNYEHIAYMGNGAEVVRMTVKDYVDNTTMPEIQLVRGSDMWTSDKAAAFGKDFAAGKYTPAPTICRVTDVNEDGDEIERYLVVDGQQRREALRKALGAGIITADAMIDVIIVSNDDADDTFRRLNIGVTVAKSIVGTMDYSQGARDNVNQLAAHPLFAALGFSAYSRQNGITAAIAQGIAATLCKYDTGKIDDDGCPIMADVWDSPSSIYTDTHNALKAHADMIPCAEWEKVETVLSDIHDALKPYTAHIAKYGKTKKETRMARGLLSSLRKKNLMLTAADAIGNGGYPAVDVLAVLADKDALRAYTDKPYRYTAMIGGKEKKMSARWTVGGGSSGSNADFEQRRIIVAAMVAEMDDLKRRMSFVVEGSDTNGADVKDAAGGAVDAVLDVVGA